MQSRKALRASEGDIKAAMDKLMEDSVVIKDAACERRRESETDGERACTSGISDLKA